MVSDFLFCGACFSNFRLCDINLFIEHKKNSCVSHSDESNSPADNFVANFLECVQCFRKFPTPWPLLLHVQSEHQLLFVNTAAQLPSDTSTRDMSRGMCFSRGTSFQSDTDVTQPVGPSSDEMRRHDFASVGTQTVLSWFKQSLSAHRKRTHPSCCIPNPIRNCASAVSNEQSCICVNVNKALCSCAPTYCGVSVSPPCGCKCCCSLSSPVYHRHNKCGALTSNTSSTLQTPSGTCFLSSVRSSSYQSNDTPYRSDKTATPFGTGGGDGKCCMSYVRRNAQCCLSETATVTASQSLTFSCCPCPPLVIKPDTTSSGVQTDLEHELDDLSYSDIAMLLASPTNSVAVDAFDTSDPVIKLDPPVRTLISQSSETQEQLSLSTDVMAVKPMLLECEVSPGPPEVTVISTSKHLTSSDPFHFVTPISQTGSILPNTLDLPPTYDRADRSDEILTENCSVLPMLSFETPSQPHPVVSQDGTQHSSLTTSPQFTCTLCGRVYKQKIHLKKHILTQHIHRKPHECPLCNYTTVEKSHLTVHIRTHTGERPFRCRACEYSSAQNCTLKSHYMRKHPDSRLHCPKCSETFYTELELEKHLRMCLFTCL